MKSNCHPPKYEVLKEFVFVNTGREYEVGEILETWESVRGLIFRGILRNHEPPKCEIPEPDCPPKDCLTNKLAKSRDYVDLEGLGESIDFPVVSGVSGVSGNPELPELPDMKSEGFSKYLPQAQLKKSQRKSKAKVEEATNALETTKKRVAKNIEMEVKMTELADEANGVKRKVKGVTQNGKV